ncbi:MAG TPA: response regulator transcription factor [Vicinamibacterales bacterium]|nr:response regulator transcription factor [Vicinamibacterales bacterium]
MDKTPLRVILADDHQIVRQGIRTLVERQGIQVVAEAGDGLTLIEQVRQHLPDLAIVDVSMPGLNGIDATRQMLASVPTLAVVLLTMHDEELHVSAALRAGVRGYVLKTQAADELMDAIRTVSTGGTYLSPKVSRMVVSAYVSGADTAADPLTARERIVLQLVAEGRTTKDIAATLNLTVKTAESYRARLMEKLDIHDTAGLVRYAIRRGVITP